MQKKCRLDTLPSQISQQIHAIAEFGALTPEDVTVLTDTLTQRIFVAPDKAAAVQNIEKAPLP